MRRWAIQLLEVKMTEEQLDKLYEIKELCCNKIKKCYDVCFSCPSQCVESKILDKINEVINAKADI